MRWVGHRNRNSHKILRRGHLGLPGIDRRIILKWVLEKIGSEDVNWIELTGQRMMGCCENGNEPLG
jgi:hypothetical protein